MHTYVYCTHIHFLCTLYIYIYISNQSAYTYTQATMYICIYTYAVGTIMFVLKRYMYIETYMYNIYIYIYIYVRTYKFIVQGILPATEGSSPAWTTARATCPRRRSGTSSCRRCLATCAEFRSRSLQGATLAPEQFPILWSHIPTI